MDLLANEKFYTELLIGALKHGKMEVRFPDMKLDPAELVEMRSFAALCKIKKIIEDDTLDDPACFKVIEEIVSTLEFLGSDGGVRHDFG